MLRSRCALRRWPFPLVAASAAWLAVVGLPLLADASPAVVTVEEDWELVLSEPDPTNTAPQVTCTIAPGTDLSGLHSTMEVNHRTQPRYAAGGVHLQIWSGETNLTRKSIENTSSLSTPGEVVRWTMRMRLQGNILTFSIQNGQSTTWGAFGGGTLLNGSYDTQLVTLAGYSPDFSVANSGVCFASNRVTSLVLKRIRYTLADGTVLTDNTVRTVYPLPSAE